MDSRGLRCFFRCFSRLASRPWEAWRRNLPAHPLVVHVSSRKNREDQIEELSFSGACSGVQLECCKSDDALPGKMDGKLPVQLLHEDARVPTKGSRLSAGMDLYSYEDVLLRGCGSTLVPIGISIALPEGTYGRIASRSSLAVMDVEVGAGVIDSDYRGEIKVLLRNFGEARILKAGTKIAQLVISPILSLEAEIGRLGSTERGVGGFGSTGE